VLAKIQGNGAEAVFFCGDIAEKTALENFK
jgi:hypothetical protein